MIKRGNIFQFAHSLQLIYTPISSVQINERKDLGGANRLLTIIYYSTLIFIWLRYVRIFKMLKTNITHAVHNTHISVRLN